MEQKTRIKGNVHYVGVMTVINTVLRRYGRCPMEFRITLI